MIERKDHLVLLLLNGVIILAAETIGGGRFFYETGLIQAFAILFSVLAVARIATHRKLHDPALKKMIQGCVLALLIFTESHVFAYLARMFGLSEDAVLVSVVNFYLAGLLLLVIGTQFVLKIRSEKRSSVIIFASVFCLLFLSILTVIFAVDDSLVSLDPAGPTPFIYAALVLIVALFGAITMREALHAMSLFERFWKFMLMGGVLVGLSALTSVFYFFLRDGIGLPDNQVSYAAIFAFYAAASLMILAFGAMRQMGGIYKDLEAEAAVEMPPGSVKT